jgi:AcrR family transcriptional regulator
MARITKPVEERRQEIIDTAKALFIEKGFDKTQVADISGAMGVAQGLVYHYFKSKVEILYAVVDEISGENEEITRQNISENSSALDSLKMLFTSLMNKEKIDKYNPLFSSLKYNPGVMEYISKKMFLSAEPFFLSLIEQGNVDGSWKCEYPKGTARFILHGLSGVIGLYPSNQDVNSKKQMLISIVLRTLGASPKLS